MIDRRLGGSGLWVSAIGLGAMPLSVSRDRPSEAEAIAVIHRAIDMGITLIDTADSYCLDDREPGHNERLIGKAFEALPASSRERVVVATKGGLVRPQGRWVRHAPPKHLRRVCEESLKNLRTDRIDLYQLHAPDPAVPLEESLGELVSLRSEGKIAHIGVSNFDVEQLVLARRIADVVSLQNQYSLNHRLPERQGTLEASTHAGIAFLPWSPLGGMRAAKSIGSYVPAVSRIAANRGLSPQRLALAWLLAKGPHVIPIPGASRTASIEDSVRAVDVSLCEEELISLDASWKES